MSLLKYVAIVEKSGKGYTAYFPSIAGCVSAGNSLKELKNNLSEALALHLRGLMEDGEELPTPENTFEETQDVKEYCRMIVEI